MTSSRWKQPCGWQPSLLSLKREHVMWSYHHLKVVTWYKPIKATSIKLLSPTEPSACQNICFFRLRRQQQVSKIIWIRMDFYMMIFVLRVKPEDKTMNKVLWKIGLENNTFDEQGIKAAPICFYMQGLKNENRKLCRWENAGNSFTFVMFFRANTDDMLEMWIKGFQWFLFLHQGSINEVLIYCVQ